MRIAGCCSPVARTAFRNPKISQSRPPSSKPGTRHVPEHLSVGRSGAAGLGIGGGELLRARAHRGAHARHGCRSRRFFDGSGSRCRGVPLRDVRLAGFRCRGQIEDPDAPAQALAASDLRQSSRDQRSDRVSGAHRTRTPAIRRDPSRIHCGRRGRGLRRPDRAAARMPCHRPHRRRLQGGAMPRALWICRSLQLQDGRPEHRSE